MKLQVIAGINKMKRAFKSLYICIISAVVFCFVFTSAGSSESDEARYYTAEEISQIAEGIIEWKSAASDALSDTALIEEILSVHAGDPSADWYALGMARLSKDYHFPVYLRSLTENVIDICESGKTAAVPVTDFHRMALTMAAIGGDPSEITPGGKSESDEAIDLIAGYTYGIGAVATLDKQGITGPIWALITLDSGQYSIPEGSSYDREAIINMILKEQRPDGGFALAGPAADPDITAMTIQALAPYYNSDLYIGVRAAIDLALARLSELQNETGDFSSWGNRNSQTGAQVMLALCCLGIDPQTDERFIKNGRTLMDGIMLYRVSDKGFANTLPAVRSNSKASEQILYSFAAVLRNMSGMRLLYDMRPEPGPDLKREIKSLREDISGIDRYTSTETLDSLSERYEAVPVSERMYVFNYTALRDALADIVPRESDQPAPSPDKDKTTIPVVIAAVTVFAAVSVAVFLKKRKGGSHT